MLRPSLMLAAIVAIAAPTVVAAKPPTNPLVLAVTGAQRSPENRLRDKHRHPVETLTFFGIKPTMTVVEISPSAGWYTEILAPYLNADGTYYAAHSNPAASKNAAAAVDRFKAKLAGNPAAYGKVKLTAFGKDSYDIAPAGVADAVLSFRNVHNWYGAGFGPQAFKAFFAALKPGGTLGIVEHRLPEAMPDAAMKDSGYMKTSYVRKLAEDAGFKFVAASEINGNPKDTHDYPEGVWTLPPNYAEGEKDRAKYTAIGESDRMTLKFVKPKA